MSNIFSTIQKLNYLNFFSLSEKSRVYEYGNIVLFKTTGQKMSPIISKKLILTLCELEVQVSSGVRCTVDYNTSCDVPNLSSYVHDETLISGKHRETFSQSLYIRLLTGKLKQQIDVIMKFCFF